MKHLNFSIRTTLCLLLLLAALGATTAQLLSKSAAAPLATLPTYDPVTGAGTLDYRQIANTQSLYNEKMVVQGVTVPSTGTIRFTNSTAGNPFLTGRFFRAREGVAFSLAHNATKNLTLKVEILQADGSVAQTKELQLTTSNKANVTAEFPKIDHEWRFRISVAGLGTNESVDFTNVYFTTQKRPYNNEILFQLSGDFSKAALTPDTIISNATVNSISGDDDELLITSPSSQLKSPRFSHQKQLVFNFQAKLGNNGHTVPLSFYVKSYDVHGKIIGSEVPAGSVNISGNNYKPYDVVITCPVHEGTTHSSEIIIRSNSTSNTDITARRMRMSGQQGIATNLQMSYKSGKQLELNWEKPANNAPKYRIELLDRTANALSKPIVLETTATSATFNLDTLSAGRYTAKLSTYNVAEGEGQHIFGISEMRKLTWVPTGQTLNYDPVASTNLAVIMGEDSNGSGAIDRVGQLTIPNNPTTNTNVEKSVITFSKLLRGKSYYISFPGPVAKITDNDTIIVVPILKPFVSNTVTFGESVALTALQMHQGYLLTIPAGTGDTAEITVHLDATSAQINTALSGYTTLGVWHNDVTNAIANGWQLLGNTLPKTALVPNYTAYVYNGRSYELFSNKSGTLMNTSGIPAFVPFFIRTEASKPTIALNASGVIVTGVPTESTPPMWRVEIKRGEVVEDALFITLRDQAKNEFEEGYDIPKMLSPNPQTAQIYTSFETNHLALVSLTPEMANAGKAITVITKEAGNYTIAEPINNSGRNTVFEYKVGETWTNFPITITTAGTHTFELRAHSLGKSDLIDQQWLVNQLSADETGISFAAEGSSMTSKFYNASNSIDITLAVTSGTFNLELLNSSGKVVATKVGTTATHNFSATNEFRIRIVATSTGAKLSAIPTITAESRYTNNAMLTQFVGDMALMIPTTPVTFTEATHTLATLQAVVAGDDEIIFDLRNKPKSSTSYWISDAFAAEVSQQIVVRFEAKRSNNGHTPTLKLELIDANGATVGTPVSVDITNKTYLDYAISLLFPSTGISGNYRVKVTCSDTTDQNSQVTCTIRGLRCNRFDNIATNTQLTSCSDNLNVSWTASPLSTYKYKVELLNSLGTVVVQSSGFIAGNVTSHSFNLTSLSVATGIYKVRVTTYNTSEQPVGTAALRNFYYVKAGEQLTMGTTSHIDLILMELEDAGTHRAINKVAEIIKSTETMSVDKVALRLKIQSGNFYFVSFPFTPENIKVNCADALLNSTLQLREFSSSDYAKTPELFNSTYPVLFDENSATIYDALTPGDGYLLSVNRSETSGNNGAVDVTIIGSVANHNDDLRFVNYNMGQLDRVESEAVTGGDGYLYQGWDLLANPFPRNTRIMTNSYVSVYGGAGSSTAGEEGDGKVHPAGYTIYRYSNDETTAQRVPTFVPFFVQSSATTFSLTPQSVASSSSIAELGVEARLSFSDGKAFDEVIFNLDEEASQFYTIGKDLTKMYSLGTGVPQVVNRLGKDALAVRSLTAETAAAGVALDLYVGTTGKQTLAMAGTEWDEKFDYFIRQANGNEVCITNEPYEFNATASQQLRLTFVARPVPLSSEQPLEQRISIAQQGDELLVTAAEEMHSIRLLDTNGALMNHVTPIELTTTLPAPTTSGVYLVEVTTTSGREVVKVIIR